MGGIGIWQLVIILVIVLLIFGTKKFKNMGSDIGGAVKGFKKAMNEADAPEKKSTETLDNKSDNKQEPSTIDVQVTKKEDSK